MYFQATNDNATHEFIANHQLTAEFQQYIYAQEINF